MAFGREDVIVRFGGDSSKLKAEMDVLERGVQKLRSGLTKLGVGVSLVATVKGAASAFTSINVEAGRLRASLETVTGSQKAAASAWKQMVDFAKQTPFALQQSVTAFTRLKALGLDPSKEAMMAYGDTAAAMGKDLMQMVEAVADATTGEFERLKEFGIKASKQGEQVTFTFRGISTTVKNEAGAIENYLKRIGQVEFAGAMERQMSTLGGALSNLRDSVDSFWTTLGDTGAASAAAAAIRDIGAAFDVLSSKISGVSWSRAMAEAFGGLVLPDLPDNILLITERISDLKAQAKELKAQIAGYGERGLTGALFGKDLPSLESELGRINAQIAQQEKLYRSMMQQEAERRAKARVPVAVPGGSGGSVSAAARPGVDTSKLNPEFNANLEALIAEGARRGFDLGILSAYRETAKQAELYAAEVRKYGSAELARKNVAPPGKSLHEKGLAADITGSAAAQRWVAENASRFGLGTYTGPGYGGSHIHVQMVDQAKAAAAAQAELAKQTKATADARAEYDAIMREGLSVQESVRTAAEEHADTVERLAYLYHQGALGAVDSAGALETYRRAVADSAKDLQDLEDKSKKIQKDIEDRAKKTKDAADELGLTFTSAFEDAVVAGNSLRDVLKGIAQDLLRLFVRETVTEPFLKLTKPFFQSIASAIFGGASKSEFGNVMTSSGPMPLQRYSAGGIATSPQLALFGEGSGAEAYVPLPDGRRIPVAMKSPGVSVTVNNMPGQDARVRDDGRGGLTIDIVRAALADDARRGGLPWTRGLEAAYGLGRAR